MGDLSKMSDREKVAFLMEALLLRAASRSLFPPCAELFVFVARLKNFVRLDPSLAVFLKAPLRNFVLGGG